MSSSPIAGLSQLQERSGQRAVIAGVYHQVDVRQKQRPPAVYAGHVAIGLDDSTEVYLEPIWSTAALRSPEERNRFDRRRVAVTGVVLARMPEPPEPAAHLMGPCVSPVEQVEPF